jgi:Ca2+-binding EF-hand superfamily protein
MLKAI